MCQLKIFLLFLFYFQTSCLDNLHIPVYCRDKNRLITSEVLDEYLLIGVETNVTIQLQCHYCHELNDNEHKIWYYQDRYQLEKEQELEIGMNSNMSMNKIHLNPVFDVIIQKFEPLNAGIYKCHGARGEYSENKFNYRLEPVFEESEFVYLQRGNLSDWEYYRNIYLVPVTNRFEISSMSSLSLIRNVGVFLEVISEWSEWGPCENCVEKNGIKASKAQCRLKSTFDNRTLSNVEVDIVNFFKKSPILPCRSQLLNEKFPIISQAIRDLPEFILEEICKCKKITKTKGKKFKYVKIYTMAPGDYLTIVCPDINKKSHVIWQKGITVLKTGHRKDNNDHVLIDTFFTLYLLNVSSEESGNYTCYANGEKILQANVVVVSRRILLTRALLRHMGYLGFILLMTFICYCGGIIYACMNPKNFADKDYKMVLAEKKEKKQRRFLQNWVIDDMDSN